MNDVRQYLTESARKLNDKYDDYLYRRQLFRLYQLLDAKLEGDSNYLTRLLQYVEDPKGS
jgi:hypothetical protein